MTPQQLSPIPSVSWFSFHLFRASIAHKMEREKVKRDQFVSETNAPLLLLGGLSHCRYLWESLGLCPCTHLSDFSGFRDINLHFGMGDAAGEAGLVWVFLRWEVKGEMEREKSPLWILTSPCLRPLPFALPPFQVLPPANPLQTSWFGRPNTNPF